MYECIKGLNKLPKGIKSSNISRFRKTAKTQLVEKCYYRVEEYLDIISGSDKCQYHQELYKNSGQIFEDFHKNSKNSRIFKE